MKKKTDKQKAEKMLADVYVSYAHMEYNLSGTVNTSPLVKFRKAVKMLGLNINQYLPPEHGAF